MIKLALASAGHECYGKQEDVGMQLQDSNGTLLITSGLSDVTVWLVWRCSSYIAISDFGGPAGLSVRSCDK